MLFRSLALLYWWEVDQQGLLLRQVNELLQVAVGPLLPVKAPVASHGLTHAVFLNHVLLIGLMVAASFIDIDEKIIPDEITVPGTLLGLLLALPVAAVASVLVAFAIEQYRGSVVYHGGREAAADEEPEA